MYPANQFIIGARVKVLSLAQLKKLDSYGGCSTLRINGLDFPKSMRISCGQCGTINSIRNVDKASILFDDADINTAMETYVFNPAMLEEETKPVLLKAAKSEEVFKTLFFDGEFKK